MIYGLCGNLNPNNIFMKNGAYQKHYPKSYSSKIYFRDGQSVKVRGHYLNNQYVVPYNPYLVTKFDCHLNVEICSTVKNVKYMCIYIRHDRIAIYINLNNNLHNTDEIKNVQLAR